MVDRPPGRLREVAVEVHGPLRNSGVRIEPEIETQTFVDIAHADDFVHPGVRKGTILLIMSTRPSAKYRTTRGVPTAVASLASRGTAPPARLVGSPETLRSAMGPGFRASARSRHIPP